MHEAYETAVYSMYHVHFMSLIFFRRIKISANLKIT